MKYIFPKKVVTAIVSLFFLMLSSQSYARHIIGGVMQYSVYNSITPGNKTIQVKLILIRDCNPASGGADFDNPAALAIYRGTSQDNVLMAVETVSPLSISFEPLTLPSGLLQPSAICEERGEYVANFELPILSAGESYFFVYQRCCKSLSFVNLLDAENSGLTVSTELTADAMNQENLSPVFESTSGVLACVHDSLEFQRKATSVDPGDSLVYQLTSLIHGGGPALVDPEYTSCEGVIPTPPCAPPYDTIPYQEQGFSNLSPLGPAVPVNFNTSNGTFSCVPHHLGAYLIGLDVVQYRNGLRLSTTHSEFAVYVFDCLVSELSQGTPDGGLQILPNPATEMITLKVADQDWQTARYSLKDVTGKEYFSGNLNGGVAIIHRKGLPAGIYLLEMTTKKDGLLTKKVVFE